MPEDRIVQIENHIRDLMSGENAHDFNHVDRVRNWALQIAEREGYSELELVQAAALFHDVGRINGESNRHAERGAEIAAAFLSERNLFVQNEVEQIAHAIGHHNSLSASGALVEILRDADILDLLGAVGIMRAFTSKHSMPEYDSRMIKGETWKMANGDFNRRFAAGIGIGDYIVDQINFQLSCYDNLRTAAARRIAQPLVEFMKAYLVRLESEITAGRNGAVG